MSRKLTNCSSETQLVLQNFIISYSEFISYIPVKPSVIGCSGKMWECFKQNGHLIMAYLFYRDTLNRMGSFVNYNKNSSRMLLREIICRTSEKYGDGFSNVYFV